MKKELKQLNRAAFWLSQAIRAAALAKGYNLDYAEARDHKSSMEALHNNTRYADLSEYCYKRYLSALDALNELTPLIR